MLRLFRWQILLAALGILLVAGLLAQFALLRETVAIPIRGGVYTEGVIGTPQLLHPLLATSDADRDISGLLFEGLSTLLPDGSIQPALAEKWEASPQGTVYTCTLRSDIYWHDGEPVTTVDVLFTLNLLRSPDFPTTSPLQALWVRIQAQALDDRRIRFLLERPYAPFLSYTTLPLLPAHLLQKVPPADLPSSPFFLHPIGTGPFRFVRLEEGEDGVPTLELEANPLYYRGLPYLEGVHFRFYRDEGVLVEALLQGEVEGAFGLSRAALERLSGRSDLVAYRAYLQAYNILFLNTRSPFLGDRRVRQALALGLDRRALVQGLEEEVFPANGPISPISWAYKPDLPAFPYDPGRAAELLEEAGWLDQNHDGVRERDIRSLELVLLTRDVPPERVALANRIKQQLASLGVSIRVAVVPPETFRRRLAERDFDLLLYGWGQLGRDPDEFVLWHSSQTGPEGSNLSSLQNETIDRLLEQGRTLLDRDLRIPIYWQFQEEFIQEVPAIPLYYPVYTYILPARLHGVELAPFNEPGERFRSITGWYLKTQVQTRLRSVAAPRYGRER
ncbi:MAG: peptide ABC transporter substrate-binding protein [Chloroflexia bacterium]